MKKLLQISLALAATVGALTSVQAQDVAAGQKKVAMCIGCHGIPGYQSSFPEVYKVPMISGQGAKYIAASLSAYAKGERKHPTMRGIALSLTEQDIADISAYYEQHGKSTTTVPEAAVPASAQVTELLNKGACASCHGANFSKPIDGSYPKIAGQHADYLYAALKSYQVEGNAVVGRGNAIMAGQVKQFSHAELKAMSKYLASLPGELKVVPQPKLR
ncbi:cytochrome c4 [Paucibacter sp. O1-1]|uniref:c-type cytochrome n=1 Tax=unclassified Roseateles TaxID=2626991 RepID=UPI0021D4DCBC|nr:MULTISPECIES: cytochrome c4 [unclassified Roseateles]MCU7373081.1 cytochrome c4 [Paucibacter sp. O1-1]MCZ7881223.1 cytochrome c4 [Paucibacter sp. M5-1]MDA3828080.1 cytochrome c4 [Paucibacter sp. O1-1]MDC6166456.1 cytochrome c4 [Paucibacter sp. XJ19-41]